MSTSIEFPYMENNYREYRCATCKKLLFKGLLVDSEVEIKCKRCQSMNTFTGVSANSLICLIPHCTNRITFAKK